MQPRKGPEDANLMVSSPSLHFGQFFFFRISGLNSFILFITSVILFSLTSSTAEFKSLRKYDIVTNVCPRSFPKGQSVEIISSKVYRENFKSFNYFHRKFVVFLGFYIELAILAYDLVPFGLGIFRDMLKRYCCAVGAGDCFAAKTT